jgi:hypothetical protein
VEAVFRSRFTNHCLRIPNQQMRADTRTSTITGTTTAMIRVLVGTIDVFPPFGFEGPGSALVRGFCEWASNGTYMLSRLVSIGFRGRDNWRLC